MSDDPFDASGFHADPRPFIGGAAELAPRAVDSFLLLVRRGMALGGGVLAIVAVVCLASYAVGIAALDGGMQTVWIVVGGAFAALAIGAVLLALFRLWMVKRLGTSLVGEVRALLSHDPQSERVVIETVESSYRVQGQSAIVMSRQFFAMSDALGDRRAQFAGLAASLHSFTTFPLLILLATTVTLVFAVLGFFFTIGLLI